MLRNFIWRDWDLLKANLTRNERIQLASSVRKSDVIGVTIDEELLTIQMKARIKEILKQ